VDAPVKTPDNTTSEQEPSKKPSVVTVDEDQTEEVVRGEFEDLRAAVASLSHASLEQLVQLKEHLTQEDPKLLKEMQATLSGASALLKQQ